MSLTLVDSPRSVLRHSQRDALLVGLALLHGGILATRPAMAIVGLGMWWCANTVAHHFIHTPFFRDRWQNRAMSLYLSLLLGLPQSIWRDRHLAHHAGAVWRMRVTPLLLVESLLVLALWAVLYASDRLYFLSSYLPGMALGLTLCWVHGYYEHAQGTTSHYGRVYNLLFFNDGYHVEHHAGTGLHWTALPARVRRGATTSRWPPVLRWLDAFSLVSLEKLVLRSPALQRFVLVSHERAFRRLLSGLSEPRRVAVVGGGLFPRTAIVLSRLLPHSSIVAIDASREHIRLAQPFAPRDVEFVCDWYDPARHDGFDLVVIPLGFVGDRRAVYNHSRAGAVIVHDWIWRRRGRTAVISLLLLKRLNLVSFDADAEPLGGVRAGQSARSRQT